MNQIKQLIRTIPDFPRPGIRFRDITPLLSSPDGLSAAITGLAARYRGDNGGPRDATRGGVNLAASPRDRAREGREGPLLIDKVAAIEARGFVFGAALAHALGVGFVPVRKPGKLPFASIGEDYELEYGSARVEIHVDGVARGERVVVVDDLLATGGTAGAAIALLERAGARVVECAFVIDLTDVGGRARLEQRGYKVHALCAFTEDEA